MSSTRERQQREAARTKLQEQMAAKAARARKRRQLQAGIGSAVALVLVGGLGIWGATALFGGEDENPTAQPSASPAAPGTCVWNPEDAGANPYAKDVGTPPTTGEPRSGTRVMTIDSNKGEVQIEMDLAHAPCTAANFAYLADKQFYDNTKCHRLTTEGIFVLQCGDPSATGMGGPTYRYAEENLPEGKTPPYPAGTLAMAKTQAPSSTGSQFFIVYKDTDLPAQYTVVGKVTKGLELVQEVAAAGAAKDGKDVSDGEPKSPFEIKTLRVGPVQGAQPAADNATP